MTVLPKSGIRVLPLLLLALVAFSRPAFATHFRTGTLSWSVDPTFSVPGQTRVIVRYDGVYRWDYDFQSGANPQLGMTVTDQNFIVQLTSISGVFQQVEIPMTVVAIDAAQDWMALSGTTTLVYQNNQFPVSALLTNCCTLSSLAELNHDQPFSVATTINPSLASVSPRSTALPVIHLTQGAFSAFPLPSVAPPGLTNTFAFSPTNVSLLPTPVPVGTPACANTACPPTSIGAMTLSSSGFLQWTPQTTGLYITQVTITARDANANAHSAIQSYVMFEVDAPCNPTQSGCNVPPAFTTPASPVTAHVGVPFTLNLAASDQNAGDIVAIGSISIPNGASFQMVGGAANPAHATMTWTPTQLGSFNACFYAQDSQGAVSLGTYCIPITVVNDAPTITCPSNISVQATSASGAAVPMSAIVQDTEGGSMTLTWSAAGSTLATDTFTAAAATAVTRSTTQTFAIGSRTVTAAVSDGHSQAQCSFSVAVTQLPQTVTFNAVGPVTYGAAPVALQASASSGLPVSFSVLSGPGSLSGGNMLAFTGAGMVEVKAHQDGDATYLPADAVQQITVQPAPLTISADNKEREIGQPNPTLTASFSGFVNGDSPASLTGSLLLSTTATIASPEGVYPITASGLSSPNYAITYVPGTLTVTVCFTTYPTGVAKAGSTIPVLIALCSGGPTNAGIIPIATSVSPAGSAVPLPAENAGQSNPGGVFRFTDQGYIFNLKTTGLAPGAYTLNFHIDGSGIIHTVPFQVR